MQTFEWNRLLNWRKISLFEEEILEIFQIIKLDQTVKLPWLVILSITLLARERQIWLLITSFHRWTHPNHSIFACRCIVIWLKLFVWDCIWRHLKNLHLRVRTILWHFWNSWFHVYLWVTHRWIDITWCLKCMLTWNRS